MDYRGNQIRSKQAKEPIRDVETWRKVAYYVGLALTAIGVVLFAVPFTTVFWPREQIFSMLANDGPFRPMAPGFLGFGLILIGQLLRNLGRKGLAGSGLLLSPQGETRDNEPWDRSKGHRVANAVDEFQDNIGGQSAGVASFLGAAQAQPVEVVKVRCRSCGYLDNESDRFCGKCGQPL